MSLRQLAIGAGSIFAVYLASNVFLERMYLLLYPQLYDPLLIFRHSRTA